jgi:hypothetical protein
MRSESPNCHYEEAFRSTKDLLFSGCIDTSSEEQILVSLVIDNPGIGPNIHEELPQLL